MILQDNIRKPSFRPSYLAPCSNHPVSHKSGILACESYRAFMLCSRVCYFDACISRLINFLKERGYPSLHPRITFDESRRRAALAKHARPAGKSGNASSEPSLKNRSTVYFVLPYSDQAKHICVGKHFRSAFSNCVPINLVVAWSVKINSMRKLYRMNWPHISESAQIGVPCVRTGIG